LTAATTLPSVALAGITDTTRQKVEALRKDFPNFKLSPEAQQCLDEKILDPECDPTINDEIAIYRDKQQLNSDKQQLNSDKQQLNSDKQQLNSDKQQLDVIKTARQNIEIVI
jgi:ABC-type thiamine transport system substrate-binding protein